jgi:hypothetical protein
MRIRLVIAGAAVVLTAGTGAAYAAVGTTTTVSPTVAGNVLPVNHNHSPTVRPTEPGDDRGADATMEPGDDHGGQSPATASPSTEPGDDRGVTPEPGDDRGGISPEAGDDRNRGQGSDDATTAAGSTSGRGSDDSVQLSSAVAGSSASGTGSDDRSRGGESGSGHH